MKAFMNNEEGNITVAFSLLTPFIIFYFLWVVSTWQAMYIQMQTKAVIDFALLGGASTGVTVKSEASDSLASSYIPVRGGNYESEVKEYGADVAKELLEINAYQTLPESVAKQLVNVSKNYWDTPDEVQLQNGGYMHMRVSNLKYRSLVPVLVNNWTFTIESTAQCQPKN